MTSEFEARPPSPYEGLGSQGADGATWRDAKGILFDELPRAVACNGLAAYTVTCHLEWLTMATTHVNQRVQKHRDALRLAGLRPVQIWVPDTRRPDFAQECRRQCLLVAQADSADTAMQKFMDGALADVDGWTE